MILVAGNARYRWADLQVVFRDMWWGAKGSDVYSDQRGEFIINVIRKLTTDACAAAFAADAPDDIRAFAETMMRRVEVEGLNTPAHLLALGRFLGRYEISDESPRDTRALDKAQEQLSAAWWSSGLDKARPRP